MKICLALLLAFSCFALPARADVSPLAINARQVYLVDAATGAVMYAKDAETQMAPSSMSKMMTAYLTFEAIRNGKLHLEDNLPVSEHAWKQEGSRMFLNVGQQAKVEDLIRGLVVQSGNDAAVTLAEGLGSGSEAAFADMMTAKAKALGMTGSHFVNATGLPDPQEYSTAHDLATLALALMHDFPEDYHYFSEHDFTYNSISQGNRNPLLYRNMNVDGLKTGHTDAGGFGLTGSALRDGRRVVFVLNGMNDMQARADESAKVLDYGYHEYGQYPVAKAGDTVGAAKVWLGQSQQVPVIIAQDALLTLPRSARAELKAVASYTQPIAAPIKQGQQIGTLVITAPGMDAKTVPLIAGADVPQVGFFARLFDKLGVAFGKKA